MQGWGAFIEHRDLVACGIPVVRMHRGSSVLSGFCLQGWLSGKIFFQVQAFKASLDWL